MAVLREAVSAEVFGHFAETCFQGSFPSGPADARFCVANNSTAPIHHLSLDQRTNSEICRSRIAARVCYQPGAANLVAVELRQPIDSFFEQAGSSMAFFVPARVVLRVTQPE